MKAMGILGSLLCLSSVSFAGVHVEKLQFNGSGCPLGSGVSHHWHEGQLILKFVDFAASRSDGLPLSNSRKNCTLTLDMASDAGTSFSISSVTGQGRASLSSGTQLNLSSSHFFQGVGATSMGAYSLNGPFYGVFKTGNVLATAHRQWSPCSGDRALSVNSAIRISPSPGSSKIDGDAWLDELQLKIETRACR